jgi:hypothetical protein
MEIRLGAKCRGSPPRPYRFTPLATLRKLPKLERLVEEKRREREAGGR